MLITHHSTESLKQAATALKNYCNFTTIDDGPVAIIAAN
jgi:hypothetical protein